jgi:hypothetical protein
MADGLRTPSVELDTPLGVRLEEDEDNRGGGDVSPSTADDHAVVAAIGHGVTAGEADDGDPG